MTQITLHTGRERRRRWSDDEQREILAAAFRPGAIVTEVARGFEVSTSMIYKWRRAALATRSEMAFVPAVVVPEAVPVRSSGWAIVVDRTHPPRTAGSGCRHGSGALRLPG
jgi:transposase